MEYPSAPTFEIYTPFILPEELFKGFHVTHEPVSYTRNGLGNPINTYEDIQERFTIYNDYLDSITPDMDIRAVSVKPICLYSNIFVEYIEFEVTINHYYITPTDALTYKLFHDFVKNINEKLSRIKNHPLKDFFVRTGTEDAFHRYGFQIITAPCIFISLPDIFIPGIIDTMNVEKMHKDILDVFHYMDSLKEYYYQRHVKLTNAEEHGLLKPSVNRDETGNEYLNTNPPKWTDSDDEQIIYAHGWTDTDDDSDSE